MLMVANLHKTFKNITIPLGPIASTTSKNTDNLTANQLEEQGQARQNRTYN